MDKLMEKTLKNKLKQSHDVLLDLLHYFEPLEEVSNIVTLCEDHTVWAETLVSVMKERADAGLPLKLVNVSTKDLPEAPGVLSVRGALTEAQTVRNVLQALGGEQERADFVLCDGLPHYEEFFIIEVYLQIQLFFASNILREDAAFMVRILIDDDQNLAHYTYLNKFFDYVHLYIPDIRLNYFRFEGYFMCTNFMEIKDYIPQTINPVKYERYIIAEFTGSEVNHELIMDCIPQDFPLFALEWGHVFETEKPEKKPKNAKNKAPNKKKNKKKHK